MQTNPQNVLGYPLHNDEKILLELKPKTGTEWYFLLSKLSRYVYLIVLISIGLGFHFSIRYGYNHPLNFLGILFKENYPGIILIALILIATMYLFMRQIVKGYDYVITNQRILLRYGFLNKNTRIIPYNKLNDVNAQASFLERCFGLETVFLDTIGTQASMQTRRLSTNTLRIEGLTPDISKQVLDMISQFLVVK